MEATKAVNSETNPSINSSTSSYQVWRPSKQFYRNKHKRNVPVLVAIFVTYMIVFFVLRHGLGWLRSCDNGQMEKIFEDEEQDIEELIMPVGGRERRLLQANDKPLTLQPATILPTPAQNRCTPRSVEQFPNDFMSLEAKKSGGVIVHALLALYMFIAVAAVCDDYFVASLERICAVTKLKADVAGATFMAAGSSAPELFTSVVGVFVTESDVGISTIVGSAVFNILCIVALCGLFAGVVVHLTWWPMTRDCGYYAFSVLALVIIIADGWIHWYEALIFIAMYVGYIVLMYFNSNIENYIKRRKRMASTADIEVEPLLTLKDSGDEEGTRDYSTMPEKEEGDIEEEEEEYKWPLTVPEGWVKRVYWAMMLPMTVAFMLTIPDCRRPGCWRRLYIVTFLLSVVWIAILSYLLVWMVCIVGDTLDIPETIMGLTLLAAGTSVPDALASIIVSRDGFGDMAVSNGVGSNVFDILMCLGLPWTLKTVILSPGATVPILSSGLIFSSIVLFSTVIILLLVVRLYKWRLNRTLGATMLIIYFVVIGICSLYETNIIVPGVNPPVCERKRF